MSVGGMSGSVCPMRCTGCYDHTRNEIPCHSPVLEALLLVFYSLELSPQSFRITSSVVHMIAVDCART